jgi:uncharacterized OsmC-like protein
VSSEHIPPIGEGQVVVRGSADGFAQEIRAGRHGVLSDEPISAGGTNTGPTPYDLLLAALGSCISMTAGVYARRKGWPLESAAVRLQHSRIHAEDCENCETKEGRIDRIDVSIELKGPLTEEQRGRILEIMRRCPVHQTLRSEIDIRSRLEDASRLR